MKKTTALLFLVLLVPAAAFAQSVNVREPVAVGEMPETIRMLRRAIESGVKQADTSGIGSAQIETWVRREGRFFHIKMVISSADVETASQERCLVEEAEGRLVQQARALTLSFSTQRAEVKEAERERIAAEKAAEEERKKQIAEEKAAVRAAAEAAKEAERERIAAEKAAEEEQKKQIAEEKAAVRAAAEAAKEAERERIAAEKAAEEERKKQIAKEKAAETKGFLDRWVHGEVGVGALDMMSVNGPFGGSLKLGLLFFNKNDPGFYFGLRPEIALYHTGLMSVSLPRINFGWFLGGFDLGFYLSPLYNFYPDSPESGFWRVEIGWNGYAFFFEGSGGKVVHRFSFSISAVVFPGEEVKAKAGIQYSLVF